MRKRHNVWIACVAGGALLMMAAGCSSLERPVASASDGAKTGMEALSKSQAAQRLLDRTAPHPAPGGFAPSFVPDPGWPKPLPHNWIIGDIGGLTVDSHDNVWVFHRPRSLTTTDAGAQGEAGKD